MVHIYCGDGKGKTTAAMGLALRMAGAGKQVLIGQFFKDGSSGEIRVLQTVPGVETLHCKTVPGRYARMTEAQRETARQDYSRYLLPLPIDQRYTPDDMRTLAALVLQLKEEGEPA